MNFFIRETFGNIIHGNIDHQALFNLYLQNKQLSIVSNNGWQQIDTIKHNIDQPLFEIIVSLHGTTTLTLHATPHSELLLFASMDYIHPFDIQPHIELQGANVSMKPCGRLLIKPVCYLVKSIQILEHQTYLSLHTNHANTLIIDTLLAREIIK